MLEVNEITGVKPTFTNSEFRVGQNLQVQWRAHGNSVLSEIKEFSDGKVVFETEEFLRGVAPGQQAVFYEGDRVVGSVVIDSSRRLNDR